MNLQTLVLFVVVWKHCSASLRDAWDPVNQPSQCSFMEEGADTENEWVKTAGIIFGTAPPVLGAVNATLVNSTIFVTTFSNPNSTGQQQDMVAFLPSLLNWEEDIVNFVNGSFISLPLCVPPVCTAIWAGVVDVVVTPGFWSPNWTGQQLPPMEVARFQVWTFSRIGVTTPRHTPFQVNLLGQAPRLQTPEESAAYLSFGSPLSKLGQRLEFFCLSSSAGWPESAAVACGIPSRCELPVPGTFAFTQHGVCTCVGNSSVAGQAVSPYGDALPLLSSGNWTIDAVFSSPFPSLFTSQPGKTLEIPVGFDPLLWLVSVACNGLDEDSCAAVSWTKSTVNSTLTFWTSPLSTLNLVHLEAFEETGVEMPDTGFVVLVQHGVGSERSPRVAVSFVLPGVAAPLSLTQTSLLTRLVVWDVSVLQDSPPPEAALVAVDAVFALAKRALNVSLGTPELFLNGAPGLEATTFQTGLLFLVSAAAGDPSTPLGPLFNTSYLWVNPVSTIILVSETAIVTVSLVEVFSGTSVFVSAPSRPRASVDPATVVQGTVTSPFTFLGAEAVLLPFSRLSDAAPVAFFLCTSGISGCGPLLHQRASLGNTPPIGANLPLVDDLDLGWLRTTCGFPGDPFSFASSPTMAGICVPSPQLGPDPAPTTRTAKLVAVFSAAASSSCDPPSTAFNIHSSSCEAPCESCGTVEIQPSGVVVIQDQSNPSLPSSFSSSPSPSPSSSPFFILEPDPCLPFGLQVNGSCVCGVWRTGPTCASVASPNPCPLGMSPSPFVTGPWCVCSDASKRLPDGSCGKCTVPQLALGNECVGVCPHESSEAYLVGTCLGREEQAPSVSTTPSPSPSPSALTCPLGFVPYLGLCKRCQRCDPNMGACSPSQGGACVCTAANANPATACSTCVSDFVRSGNACIPSTAACGPNGTATLNGTCVCAPGYFDRCRFLSSRLEPCCFPIGAPDDGLLCGSNRCPPNSVCQVVKGVPVCNCLPGTFMALETGVCFQPNTSSSSSFSLLVEAQGVRAFQQCKSIKSPLPVFMVVVATLFLVAFATSHFILWKIVKKQSISDQPQLGALVPKPLVLPSKTNPKAKAKPVLLPGAGLAMVGLPFFLVLLLLPQFGWSQSPSPSATPTPSYCAEPKIVESLIPLLVRNETLFPDSTYVPLDAAFPVLSFLEMLNAILGVPSDEDVPANITWQTVHDALNSGLPKTNPLKWNTGAENPAISRPASLMFALESFTAIKSGVWFPLFVETTSSVCGGTSDSPDATWFTDFYINITDAILMVPGAVHTHFNLSDLAFTPRRFGRRKVEDSAQPYAFMDETTTWSIIASHARTTAIRFIGERLESMAAAAGFPSYASDPLRSTTDRRDRLPTAPPSIPAGGATYAWGPVEYNPQGDRVTYRVLECAGTAAFGAAVSPDIFFPQVYGMQCQTNKSALLLSPDQVLDTFETAYRKKRGIISSAAGNPNFIQFAISFPNWTIPDFTGTTWLSSVFFPQVEFGRTLGVVDIPPMPWSIGTPWVETIPHINALEAQIANLEMTNSTKNATLKSIADNLQAWAGLQPGDPGYGNGVYFCITPYSNSAGPLCTVSNNILSCPTTADTTCQNASIATVVSLVSAELDRWSGLTSTSNAWNGRLQELNKAMLPFLFSPDAYTVATVCENTLGFVRCGDLMGQGSHNVSNPRPLSDLLEPICGSPSIADPSVQLQQCTEPTVTSANYNMECAAATGACYYGVSPQPLNWVSTICDGTNTCTPIGECATYTCVTPFWNVSSHDVLAAWREGVKWTYTPAANGDAPTLTNAMPMPKVDLVTGEMWCQLTTGGDSCLTRCGDPADPLLVGLTDDHPPVPCSAEFVQGAAEQELCANFIDCATAGFVPSTPAQACYAPPDTVYAMSLSGAGCHGAGTCFDSTYWGAKSTCTCTAGRGGQFCEACTPGRWGVVTDTSIPTCAFSCLSHWVNDTAFVDEDTSGVVTKFVWVPELSTGIYNLTDACLRPGKMGGPWANPPLAIPDGFPGALEFQALMLSISRQCGLLDPVADAVEWLRVAESCVIETMGAQPPFGQQTRLGVICDFSGTVSPVGSEQTLQSIYQTTQFPLLPGVQGGPHPFWPQQPWPAFMPITPETILGCPPASVWENDTARDVLLASLFQKRGATVPPPVSDVCEAAMRRFAANDTPWSNYTGIFSVKSPVLSTSETVDCTNASKAGISVGWEGLWPSCSTDSFDLADGYPEWFSAPTACQNTYPWLHVNVAAVQQRALSNLTLLNDTCAPLCDPVALRNYVKNGTGNGNVGESSVHILGCTQSQVPPAWLLDSDACSDARFYSASVPGVPMFHLRHMVEISVTMNGMRLRDLTAKNQWVMCPLLNVVTILWCYQLDVLLAAPLPAAADQAAVSATIYNLAVAINGLQGGAFVGSVLFFFNGAGYIMSDALMGKKLDLDQWADDACFSVIGQATAGYQPTTPTGSNMTFNRNVTKTVDTLACPGPSGQWPYDPAASYEGATTGMLLGEESVQNLLGEVYYKPMDTVFGRNFGVGSPFPFPIRVCTLPFLGGSRVPHCFATTDVPTFGRATGTSAISELGCPPRLIDTSDQVGSTLMAVAAALNAPQNTTGRVRPYHVCDPEVFYASQLAPMLSSFPEPGPLVLEPQFAFLNMDAGSAVLDAAAYLSAYASAMKSGDAAQAAAYLSAGSKKLMFSQSGASDPVAYMKSIITSHYTRSATPYMAPPIPPSKSTWAANPVQVIDASAVGRPCGGPRRALVCTLASAEACLQAGFIPCPGNTSRGGIPSDAFHVNNTFFCFCQEAAGCSCAPGSNLDPSRACGACLPGAFFSDSGETACLTAAACIAPLSGQLCGGSSHGTCFIVATDDTTGRIVQMTEYVPNQEEPLPPDNSHMVATCVCATGWAGPVCSIQIPPSLASMRVDPAAEEVVDASTSAMVRRQPGWKPCGTSSLVVATTWATTYEQTCSLAEIPCVAQACWRAGAAFALRVFAFAYGSVSMTPADAQCASSTSTVVQSARRSDVQECAMVNSDIPTISEFMSAPAWDRKVYNRYWFQRTEVSGAMSSTAAAVALNGSLELPNVWAPQPSPRRTSQGPITPATVTNATFCIRLRTDDRTGFVAVLIPLYGKVVLTSAALPPNLDMETLPQSEASTCDFFAAPLCIMKNCLFGSSETVPDTTYVS